VLQCTIASLVAERQVAGPTPVPWNAKRSPAQQLWGLLSSGAER
jgi:hypothetical protein